MEQDAENHSVRVARYRARDGVVRVGGNFITRLVGVLHGDSDSGPSVSDGPCLCSACFWLAVFSTHHVRDKAASLVGRLTRERLLYYAGSFGRSWPVLAVCRHTESLTFPQFLSILLILENV